MGRYLANFLWNFPEKNVTRPRWWLVNITLNHTQNMRHITVTSHGHHHVSNHQNLHCLLNRLFWRTSKKASKLRVTGLCEWNPPVTGGFPSQRPITRKMFSFDDIIVCILWGANCMCKLYSKQVPWLDSRNTINRNRNFVGTHIVDSYCLIRHLSSQINFVTHSRIYTMQIKYGLPFCATCPSMSADPGSLNPGTRRSRVPGWWDPRIRTNTGAGDTVLAKHT